MDPISVAVEKREDTGKSFAGKLRREGKIPAVLYGSGQEAVSLTVTPDALAKALDNPRKRNTFLSIEFGGEKRNALVKDVQIDPVTRKPLHVDFLEVAADKEVQREVPLVLTGKSKGVQLGGQLYKLARTLKVVCKAAEIPEAIELDITSLGMNQQRNISDLPKIDGLSYKHPENLVIVQLKAARAAAEELDEDEEGAEGAEGAADAEAPAAE